MTLSQKIARKGGKARAKALSKAHRKSIARAGGMARARCFRALEDAKLARKRNAEAMKTGSPLVAIPKYTTPGAFGGVTKQARADKAKARAAK